MTLAETLLPRLSEWRPSGEGRHTWSESVPAAGWAVHLTADKNDTLSTLVWELTLARTGAAPAGFALKDWAAGVADRVSGLMEDLKVLEVDGTRDEALLRSDDPTRKGADVLYYEVRLHGTGRAEVRRFKAAATKREQVPFALTHESLAKLAGDLAG